MLPLDVGQLGVDVALDPLMPAELRGQVAEAPRDVAIASRSRYRAELGTDQRFGPLRPARHVIERRSAAGLCQHLSDVPPRPTVVVEAEMP